MGERDSSKTRVEPIFDALHKRDASGTSWLARLLRLPEGGSDLQIVTDDIGSIEEYGWGAHEKKLEAP